MYNLSNGEQILYSDKRNNVRLRMASQLDIEALLKAFNYFFIIFKQNSDYCFKRFVFV